METGPKVELVALRRVAPRPAVRRTARWTRAEWSQRDHCYLGSFEAGFTRLKNGPTRDDAFRNNGTTCDHLELRLRIARDGLPERIAARARTNPPAGLCEGVAHMV